MHVCMYVPRRQVHTCVFTPNSPSLRQRVPGYYVTPTRMPSLPSSWEEKQDFPGCPLPPQFPVSLNMKHIIK